MNKGLPAFLHSIFFLLAFTALWAQEFRATILGKVIDAQGAALPGVTVEVTNIDTNRTIQTLSNDEGNYNTPFLDPERYRISAELPGFKRAVREGLVLQLNDRITIDLRLEVGEINDQITVVAETPIIDTDFSASETSVTMSMLNPWRHRS